MVNGLYTKDDITRNIELANKKMNYSKKLEVFTPVNIEMLVSLSDIDPEVLDFENSDIKKGTTCQMIIYPTGDISIGYFNSYGSGTCYHTVRKKKDFEEGEHFKFF